MKMLDKQKTDLLTALRKIVKMNAEDDMEGMEIVSLLFANYCRDMLDYEREGEWGFDAAGLVITVKRETAPTDAVLH